MLAAGISEHASEQVTKKKPKACNRKTASSSRPPEFLTCSALVPMMLAQIKTMVTTETSGAAGSTALTSRGVGWCSASPTISGIS